MPKKRGQDEEILLFAMKVVGPVAVFFIAAAITDMTHLMQWASSGPIDSALYAVSGIASWLFPAPSF
jgi:hypothetical protein